MIRPTITVTCAFMAIFIPLYGIIVNYFYILLSPTLNKRNKYRMVQPLCHFGSEKNPVSVCCVQSECPLGGMNEGWKVEFVKNYFIVFLKRLRCKGKTLWLEWTAH